MNKGNEETIINGIDVSGCKFLRCDDFSGKPYQTCDGAEVGIYAFECKDNPDCYYKQLSRTKTQYNAVVEQNRSLQTELAKAKTQIEAFELSENEAKEIIAELAKDNNVLLKALKEIEEIARKSTFLPCIEDDEGNEPDCNNCTDEISDYGSTCMKHGLMEILEKTKEVEND